MIIFYFYLYIYIYIYIIFNHSNHFSPLGHHFSITNAHVTCTLLKNDKKIWSELYISRQNIKFLKILSFIKTFHPTYSNYTWNLNIFFFFIICLESGNREIIGYKHTCLDKKDIFYVKIKVKLIFIKCKH